MEFVLAVSLIMLVPYVTCAVAFVRMMMGKPMSGFEKVMFVVAIIPWLLKLGLVVIVEGIYVVTGNRPTVGLMGM